MYRLLVIAALLPAACKGKDTEVARDDKARTTEPACAKAVVHGPLRWIEDDYPAALACAKARNLPLVVDLWAPWCHTCLSMQTTVFTDPSFAADADRFVFVAIDTDREVNAAIVDKLPLSAWPTFYVITHDEAVLARYVGAASKEQFHAFLDAGARAVTGVEGAGKHLLAAERALAVKDLATAETELSAALVEAPAGWVRKPDVLVSLLHTMRKRGHDEACLNTASTFIDETGTSASATDFMAIGLDCAKTREPLDPDGAAAFRHKASGRLQKLVDDQKSQLSVDDRSDAMIYLRDALDTSGFKPEAIAVAEKQAAMLANAAAKATSPKAAMTYNWHLAEVHVYLGRPLDAVPALEKSARELPGEYDPAARLGAIYLKADKLSEAAMWTEKAIALAYGPRKARVLGQRAEIAAKQGDVRTERAYREQVVTLWSSLPPGQANPDALTKAKEALAKLDAPATGTGSGSGSGSR
ncbi:MAG: thioredoxin family protein [Deltaproteobacteria bacterium]|nr:thioredoxin family protein [Deltaproteobacteria bacterium]